MHAKVTSTFDSTICAKSTVQSEVSLYYHSVDCTVETRVLEWHGTEVVKVVINTTIDHELQRQQFKLISNLLLYHCTN